LKYYFCFNAGPCSVPLIPPLRKQSEYLTNHPVHPGKLLVTQ
jgi:hypothetical protein